MTNSHERFVPAPLPIGYDDRESEWWIKPEHRADYVTFSVDDMPPAERVTLREALAASMYDAAVDAWRTSTIAEYMRRHDVSERDATRYLGNLRGNVVPGPDVARELHARCGVGGTDWPADAEARVEHLWRRECAVKVADMRVRYAADVEANTCPMCHDVVWPGRGDHGTEPARRVVSRIPVRGLPPVVVCGVCADAIAHVHAERAATEIVVDGKSRRDLASEFLDATAAVQPAPVSAL